MNPIELLKQRQKKNCEIENELTTFINPFSYLFFRKNLLLFKKFDHLLIDGIALIYLLRIIGIKTSRFSFDMTSLAPKVFNSAIQRNKSVFFIGSDEESIMGFVKVIKLNFKELSIKGFRNGYFADDNEREDVLNNIAIKNPDIVIVGMGTPLQELFLVELKGKGWKGSGFTCGGFIHQTIANSNYYPDFFDRYNLRWLYRMFDEPKLIKRYLFLYPKSVLLFYVDFIKYTPKK